MKLRDTCDKLKIVHTFEKISLVVSVCLALVAHVFDIEKLYDRQLWEKKKKVAI